MSANETTSAGGRGERSTAEKRTPSSRPADASPSMKQGTVNGEIAPTAPGSPSSVEVPASAREPAKASSPAPELAKPAPAKREPVKPLAAKSQPVNLNTTGRRGDSLPAADAASAPQGAARRATGGTAMASSRPKAIESAGHPAEAAAAPEVKHPDPAAATPASDGAPPVIGGASPAGFSSPRALQRPVPATPGPEKGGSAKAAPTQAASATADASAALQAPKRSGPAEPVHVPRDKLAPDGDVDAVLRAEHRDPFAFLGMHPSWYEGPMVVRAFLPWARGGTVLDAVSGEPVGRLERIRDEGFFAAVVQGRKEWFAYRLRLVSDAGEVDIDDPYRFPPILDDGDVHLLAEGSHLRSWQKLGAHPLTVQGVDGVAFTVWAPHAGRVAVIGDFNDWDGRRHGMRLRHECGVWEIFIPGLRTGHLYKFEIKAQDGRKLPDKSDPVAFATEKRPGSASIICGLRSYTWADGDWMAARQRFIARECPVSIYQLHLGSWRRKPEEGHRALSYEENAAELIAYVRDTGFSHVQLMPIAEYDSDTSVGYQPLGPFAPTSRWGTPDEFRLLVDQCHQAGIGVLVDWVPGYFSEDPHGLALFDGTHLYEHADPGQRRRPNASGLVYDLGRREVVNYLIANALFWLDEYHLDGFRIPAVETMLYRDFGRSRGEWTPNRYGGHENLEAVEFLRRLNEVVYAQKPGVFTIAQENSAWQRVSHPTFVGGLGFGFRWNTAWVRDTLRYLSRNPVHRKYYHDELLRGPGGAFHENFVLPISHEEVSIGRGSILRKMPGDRWQRFANLRTYYALMYAHPGKKLLFMGTEFAQEREWNSEISLDWHLLDDPMHRGVQRLVRDLNALYRSTPALYEQDCEPDGFQWIDCNDSDQSVVSFLREGKHGEGHIAVVCNFTPVVRPYYRVGVPAGGFWEERLNTDAEAYGGSNVGNAGGLKASEEPMHGRPFSLTLRLPPFAAVVLEHKPQGLAC